MDDITQDRVVGIARAGQGREHDEWAQQGSRGQRGADQSRADGMAGGLNRVKGTVRAGQRRHDRIGQGNIWQGKTRHGTTGAGAGAHSAQGKVVTGAEAVAGV